MSIELREDERKAKPAAEPTVERIRKSVEDVTGRLLPRFFRPAPANVAGSSGSGPVTKAIDGADVGRWFNEVVSRHRANVYGWGADGQPIGTQAEAPGSLRVEDISEARAVLRERLGREPTDSELEAMAVLMGAVNRRQLGDASATVPPGSHATALAKALRKDVHAVSSEEVADPAPTDADFGEGPRKVDRTTGVPRCPRCGTALEVAR